jgi:hypothetical protein
MGVRSGFALAVVLAGVAAVTQAGSRTARTQVTVSMQVLAARDPASVLIRDLGGPAAQFTDQRFLPRAATSTEILSRHVVATYTTVHAW